MSQFIIVQRDEWGARHSPGRSPMPAPVNALRIHHTVTTPTADPCRDMRNIERILNQRGLAPGYSFTIHPSGVILVGAGSNKGAHTSGQNGTSYGIAFIGNYESTEPNWAQFAAAGYLMNALRFVGAIPADLHETWIAPHSDTSSTACPGRLLRPKLEAIRWWAGMLS